MFLLPGHVRAVLVLDPEPVQTSVALQAVHAPVALEDVVVFQLDARYDVQQDAVVIERMRATEVVARSETGADADAADYHNSNSTTSQLRSATLSDLLAWSKPVPPSMKPWTAARPGLLMCS